MLDNELSPCFIDMKETEDMQTFGVVSEISCNFKLLNLARNDPMELPETANAFYELYLEDANSQLVDVPVLIKNFRDINGDNPNSSYNVDSSRLTHRFMMYDTVSGITNRNGYRDGR